MQYRSRVPVSADEVGLAYHARRRPQHAAILFGARVVTYGELDARVNRLAQALRQNGIRRGDSIAALLHNSVEWLELLNAAGKLGALLVPVGYRLKPPEIAYMVEDAGAKLIVASTALQDELARACETLRYPADRIWLVDDRRDSEGPLAAAAPPLSSHAYEQVLQAAPAAALDDAFVGGGFNVLTYTSGTTGRPKGIQRATDPTVAHLQLLGVANMWGFTPADVHLVNGPLYHTAPCSYAQVHLLIGATAVLVSHFDAAQALALIAKHRVSNTFMVPTHFARITQLEAAQQHAHDLSSLRLVLHSAAPCPAHVKRAIMQVFPPHSVTEFYGASESGFSKITAEEWLRKPGSVGQPWPGHDIRILDDTGEPCAAGAVGTVYVRSPAANFEYRGAREKTADAFRDGYFTAGDLGYLDSDGYLFLVDRRTDLIISGGANIYPAEVEAVIMQHPAVADVAVIGVADADMGKAVVAIVELRPGTQASAADIIAAARRDLAHYKCPRRIIFVAQLPREPSGKVRKHELIAAVEGG